MNTGTKIMAITLHKQGEQYVFRYLPGQELKVSVTMLQYALNPNLSFSLEDADEGIAIMAVKAAILKIQGGAK